MNTSATSRGRLGPNDGFGLVEVMVALMCFGICIAGMCALSLELKEASDLARDHYTAVNLAKSRLERAKVLDFASLPLMEESNVRINTQGIPDDTGHYQRTTTVSNITPALCEVAVDVEIRNRVTLEFRPGAEDIRSYIADMVVVE